MSSKPTDPQEKTSVREHTRNLKGDKVALVQEHDRTKPQRRKRLSAEEMEKRSSVGSQVRSLSKQETNSDYITEEQDFTKLPKQVQLLSLAVLADVPGLLWGDPGTGKSFMTEQVSDSFGLPAEIVIAGASEQSDFDGVPVAVEDDGKTKQKRLHPEWAENIADENAVLFLDEINRAKPAVQNALLTLITKRRIEGKNLGSGVRIVAAANPEDEGVFEMGAALRRRFFHIEWELDQEAQMRHYSRREWVAPSPDIADQIPTPEELEEGTERWSNLAGLYFKSADRDHMHMNVEELSAIDPSKNGYGYPNKESWENSFRMLAIAEKLGVSDDTKRSIVAGCVGKEVAASFWEFQKKLDMPDPNALISNPDMYSRPERSDETFFIVNSVVSAVEREPTPERWTNAVSVMCRVLEGDDGDVGAEGVRSLLALRNNYPELKSAAVPSEDVKKFAPILIESGILKK